MGCVHSVERDTNSGRPREKAKAKQPDAQPDVVTLATARLYQGFHLQHSIEDCHLPEDQELEQQPFPGAVDNPDRLSPSTPTSSHGVLSAPLALQKLHVLSPRASANGALPPEHTGPSGSAYSQPWHCKDTSHPPPAASTAPHNTQASSASAAAPSEADDDDVSEQEHCQPGGIRSSRPSMQTFFKGMLRLSKRRRLVRFESRGGRESEAGVAGEEKARRQSQSAPLRHTSSGAQQGASSLHMQQHDTFLAHVSPPPNLNSYSAQSMRLHRVSRSGSVHGGAATQRSGSSFYKESSYKGSQYSFGGSLHGGSAFSNRSSPRTTPTSLTATSRALSALTHASSAQLSRRNAGGTGSSAGNTSGQLSCSLAQQGQRAYSTSLIPGSPEGARMLTHTSIPGMDKIQTARTGMGKPGQFWSASARGSGLLSEDIPIPSLPIQEEARHQGFSEPGCGACQSSTSNAHCSRGSPQGYIDQTPAAPQPPCPHQSNAGCNVARAARPSSLAISAQPPPSHHVDHLHPPSISPTSSYDCQPSHLAPSRAASGLLPSSPCAADPAASIWSQQQQQGPGAPPDGSQLLQQHAGAPAPHLQATPFSSNISRRSSQILSFAEPPVARRGSVHLGPSVLFSKNDVQVTGLPPSLLTSARGAQRQLSNSSSLAPSSSGTGMPINSPQASTPLRIRNHRGSIESPRVAQGGTSISGALALHDAMGPPGTDAHSSAHSSSHHSGGGVARGPAYLLATSSTQMPPQHASSSGALGPPVSSSCSRLPAQMLSPEGAGPACATAATACKRVHSLDITRPSCIWETDQQHHDAAAGPPHNASVVSPRKAFVLMQPSSKDGSSRSADAQAGATMRMSGGGSAAGDGHGWSADGRQRDDADGNIPGTNTPVEEQHGSGDCACPLVQEVPARGHTASPPPRTLQASSTQTCGSSDFASGATALLPSSQASSPRAAQPAPSQQPFHNPFPLQNSGAQVHLLAQQPHYPHAHTPLASVSPRPSMYGASSAQIHPPTHRPLFSPWPHSLPLGDEACPVADEKLERARAEEALIAACRNALTNSTMVNANSSQARVSNPNGSAPNSTLNHSNSSSKLTGPPPFSPAVPILPAKACNPTAAASNPSAKGSSNADPAGNLSSSNSSKPSAGTPLAPSHSGAKQVLGAPGKQALAQSGDQLPSLTNMEPGCEAGGINQGLHPDAPAQDMPSKSMRDLKRHLPPRCFSEGNLSFRNRCSQEMARNASMGRQPPTPEHALPCWVAESAQAAEEQAANKQASLEPKRSRTHEDSNANWAINSMPDALDEAYKAHVLGSSMGVDFVFDDEDEDGGMGPRGSSGSDDDEGGEVEFKYDMSGASRPEITLPSRFRSNTVGHAHPHPRNTRHGRSQHQHSSQGNARTAPTKQASTPARPKKRELGSLLLHGSGSAFSSGSGANALNRRSSATHGGPVTESSYQ
ncbi:hypothetical protein DUNSADRAFT_17731 [Dunaliella salina]|uniref:Uncharacterized protein n=1 Tax=Dunaliella salina TaxID=3046 RepID=A0ABQ7GZU7_DUNSA|nr:hypothetical protein DUNSADRAFT_17731 [Dunaliella salina]|eukprot:KAF5840130.1 hypothetical protein DUNSADRAFT_17731 [Dunaliella salina]